MESGTEIFVGFDPCARVFDAGGLGMTQHVSKDLDVSSPSLPDPCDLRTGSVDLGHTRLVAAVVCQPLAVRARSLASPSHIQNHPFHVPLACAGSVLGEPVSPLYRYRLLQTTHLLGERWTLLVSLVDESQRW